MKKILSIVFAFICMACASSAQNTFVATLQHGDTVSNYYGTNALVEAYNASETGDIILLSAGVFNSVNIEKGITIRGVGLGQDNKSCIKNDFKVYSKDASWKTSFEGIYAINSAVVHANDCTIKAGRIEFVKSQFGELSSSYSGSPSVLSTPKVNIIQCVTNGFSTSRWSSFTCYNSLIQETRSMYSLSTTASNAINTTFINCVINPRNRYGVGSIVSAVLMNCILLATSDNHLPSTSIAYNCLGIFNTTTTNFDMFSDLPFGQKQNCWNVKDITTIFKTFNGTFDDYSETFELTEEGQQYLGTDGTQIGMQGGSVKYSTVMSYPVITYMLADDKTTKDGKLNVKIEVSTGE